ncbi:MAG TPA: MFS transporter [Pirellulales bacterium]|jgi:fucose permease|nr:MFS transporter [Pirellulales bacterium]
MIDRRWLFICSCVALITSAFTFVVRGDILQEMGDAFELTQEQKGGIEGAVFIGMALSMLVGGFICDLLGMKRIMLLAFLSHLVGSLATIFTPHSELSYQWLFGSSVLMGFGNGFTEVGINPLIATLYADRKTHYLNMLHAWWPGGLVIGGLSAQLLVRPFFPEGLGTLALWQTALCLIALPAAAYGLMLIPAKFPLTERVESGVSTGDMFKECLRPLFLVWGFCMLLTAATELGPQKWQESVMQSTAGISGTLILVYTSGMMFVLRHFAGPIAHQISPVGMMLGSAMLSGIGLFMLSYADSARTAFGFATVFGLGIAFFWPTMLGVTAERFPKGGALALALMGSIGNLSISQVLPQMGRIVDTYAVRYVEAEATPKTVTLALRKDKGRFVSANAAAVDERGPATYMFKLDKLGMLKSPETLTLGKLESVVDKLNVAAKVKTSEKNEESEKKDLLADLSELDQEPKIGPLPLIEKIKIQDKLDRLKQLQPPKSKSMLTVTQRVELMDDVTKAARAGQSQGYRMAFRWVSLLPAILIVIFSGVIIYDRSRGGYKPEILISREEEDELFAGGVQGAVE